MHRFLTIGKSLLIDKSAIVYVQRINGALKWNGDPHGHINSYDEQPDKIVIRLTAGEDLVVYESAEVKFHAIEHQLYRI